MEDPSDCGAKELKWSYGFYSHEAVANEQVALQQTCKKVFFIMPVILAKYPDESTILRHIQSDNFVICGPHGDVGLNGCKIINLSWTWRSFLRERSDQLTLSDEQQSLVAGLPRLDERGLSLYASDDLISREKETPGTRRLLHKVTLSLMTLISKTLKPKS